MKSSFLVSLLAFFLSAVSMQAQDKVSAMVTDDNGAYTNIRNAPKGKVVDKLSTKVMAVVQLTSPRNGWWRIVGGCCEDYENDVSVSFSGSTTGYWIHYSCVGFLTRNYGGQRLSLYAAPSSRSKALYSFSEPETLLHPVNVKGEWVKVKTKDGKHEGWINSEWLCYNPLTTCP